MGLHVQFFVINFARHECRLDSHQHDQDNGGVCIKSQWPNNQVWLKIKKFVSSFDTLFKKNKKLLLKFQVCKNSFQWKGATILSTQVVHHCPTVHVSLFIASCCGSIQCQGVLRYWSWHPTPGRARQGQCRLLRSHEGCWRGRGVRPDHRTRWGLLCARICFIVIETPDGYVAQFMDILLQGLHGLWRSLKVWEVSKHGA